jgi:hypothetical protein
MFRALQKAVAATFSSARISRPGWAMETREILLKADKVNVVFERIADEKSV